MDADFLSDRFLSSDGQTRSTSTPFFSEQDRQYRLTLFLRGREGAKTPALHCGHDQRFSLFVVLRGIF